MPKTKITKDCTNIVGAYVHNVLDRGDAYLSGYVMRPVGFDNCKHITNVAIQTWFAGSNYDQTGQYMDERGIDFLNCKYLSNIESIDGTPLRYDGCEKVDSDTCD